MASVNKTSPHCVNQMGKTHSEPLAAWHGRGTAWARHTMCESASILPRQASNVLTTIVLSFVAEICDYVSGWNVKARRENVITTYCNPFTLTEFPFVQPRKKTVNFFLYLVFIEEPSKTEQIFSYQSAMSAASFVTGFWKRTPLCKAGTNHNATSTFIISACHSKAVCVFKSS